MVGIKLDGFRSILGYYPEFEPGETFYVHEVPLKRSITVVLL